MDASTRHELAALRAELDRLIGIHDELVREHIALRFGRGQEMRFGHFRRLEAHRRRLQAFRKS